MRKLLWCSLALVFLAAVVEDLSRREGFRAALRRSTLHGTSETIAQPGSVTPTPKQKTHCGCVNWKACEEPCSFCCGKNGYEDCFKNPDPTIAPPKTMNCCAR